MPRNFEDTNSKLYRDAVRAGYQFEERNDGEGGSYMKLIGIDPPKHHYAPPRQRQIKQVGPPPKAKEEKKKPLEDQPQKLPDPVVKGREDIEDFNENYDKIWKQPEDTKYKGPDQAESSQATQTDAVSMAENAWNSTKDESEQSSSSEASEESFKEAKEKAQARLGLGPGQTSNAIDYNALTGENITQRGKDYAQQATQDFHNNWGEWYTPNENFASTFQKNWMSESKAKLMSPEGF